jgi:hypothetical protein
MFPSCLPFPAGELAKKGGSFFYYVLHLLVLKVHFLDSPCFIISLPFVCLMFGRYRYRCRFLSTLEISTATCP